MTSSADTHSLPCNAAKHAFRTQDNNVLDGLTSTYLNCPIHLWDRLIPQSTTPAFLLNKVMPLYGNPAQWSVQLQRNTHGTTWYSGDSTQETVSSRIMSTTYFHMLVHGPSTWALQVLDCVCQQTAAESVCIFSHQCALPTLLPSDLDTKADIELIQAPQNPTPDTPSLHSIPTPCKTSHKYQQSITKPMKVAICSTNVKTSDAINSAHKDM